MDRLFAVFDEPTRPTAAEPEAAAASKPSKRQKVEGAVAAAAPATPASDAVAIAPSGGAVTVSGDTAAAHDDDMPPLLSPEEPESTDGRKPVYTEVSVVGATEAGVHVERAELSATQPAVKPAKVRRCCKACVASVACVSIECWADLTAAGVPFHAGYLPT